MGCFRDKQRYKRHKKAGEIHCTALIGPKTSLNTPFTLICTRFRMLVWMMIATTLSGILAIDPTPHAQVGSIQKMIGETLEVRSDKRKPREKKEREKREKEREK